MKSHIQNASRFTLQTGRSSGIHEDLFIRALSGMDKGELGVELPDGSQLCFGQGNSEVKAPAPAAAARLARSARMRIRDPRFFERCTLYGDIGFAESFMAGEWDTPDIAAVIAWFILNIDQAPTLSGSGAKRFGTNLLRLLNRAGHLLRPNSRRLAVSNVREHYDLSNEFFRLWLDPTMMYSSGLWTAPDQSLAEAQFNKNEALCRKLRLKPEDTVLEIGSGWGGWSIHAASRHGCRVVTITLSEKQYAEARKRVAEAGLESKIEIRLQDYRDIPSSELYDKIVSIEMLEAVGHRYLETWCATVSRCLKPDGLMALQFITCPDARYDAFRSGVDFIQKHVFPGTLLLSLNRLNGLLSKRGGFALHELQDLGQDYARTLKLWHETFMEKISDVRNQGFDESFLRKWRYYLAYCEAAFALRNISVVQAVYSRPNNLGF